MPLDRSKNVRPGTRESVRTVLLLIIVCILTSGVTSVLRAAAPVKQETIPAVPVVRTLLDLPEGTLVGVTIPARKATLASVMPARITRIIAGEGVFVEAGAPVVELDDAVQRARVEMARSSAEATISIELAQMEWEQAEKERERLERLRDDASASRKELDDARTIAKARKLQFELEQFNHEQARRALQREQALLDEHHLRAPFGGWITEHLKHDGESVDSLEGIVVLMQLDPLKITVDCPLERAGSMAVGDQALIAPIGVARSARTGRVVHVSPAADSGSQTFRIKLEVSNTDSAWFAGMKVGILFDADTGKRAVLTTHQLEEAKE